MSAPIEPFKSIVVDIDATAPAHPALDRAVRLARASGARLTIVDVLTVPAEARRSLRPDLEEQLVDRRRQHLARIAQTVRDVGASSALLAGQPAVALMREVQRGGHDLLVRAHARDLVARGYGAVDMALIRKCPCPVLVIGPGVPQPQPRILGAIHASAEDPVERALNVKLIELTLLLARLEGGSATLLEAWTPFAEDMIRSQVSDDAFVTYVDDVRRRTSGAFSELTRELGDRLAGVQTVLRRGAPEEVIPEFAVSGGFETVVMGTMARSGLAGWLIGNTAERVLQRLPSSVLAVKPDGFVSPLRADASA